jgi:hypothetical protein
MLIKYTFLFTKNILITLIILSNFQFDILEIGDSYNIEMQIVAIFNSVYFHFGHR